MTTVHTEADLSACVLAAVDDQLVALREIRDGLRMGGTIGAGARRELAVRSVAVSAAFAQRMAAALGLPGPR